MLALTVAMGLMLQAPQDMKEWVDRGFDPARPAAAVVAGAPELEPDQAWDAVVSKVHAQRRISKAEAGRRLAGQRAAAWLPAFVLEPVVERWARDAVARQPIEVIDRDLLVREHGFGQSYQAFLLVTDKAGLSRGEARLLERRISRMEHRILVRSGCTAGLWALIALAGFWLDRLTRGYMTGRLTLIGGLLSLFAPGIFLLP